MSGGKVVVEIQLRYLVKDKDRHGNWRHYVRVPGRPKVRIRGVPGAEKFMTAYHAAIVGSDGPVQAREVRKGSLRHLCILFFGSTAFTGLDLSTQSWMRRHLDRLCTTYGALPVAMLRDKHVRKMRDELKATPAASKNRLKALRKLFGWAVEEGEAPHNPTLGVKALGYVTKGHHSWEIDEVEAFEQRHPVGSKARLALALLMYTTCRREDAPRLGPQHVKNERIKYRQAKNEHNSPIDMDIPVHPDLATVLDATPTSGHLTFLVTDYGKPYSANGFGNAFKDWCRQANLPHCSAHGLRKATAARLAERGATPHEIMAITGHKTLEEVESYTRAAQKAGLADSGMAKLKRQLGGPDDK